MNGNFKLIEAYGTFRIQSSNAAESNDFQCSHKTTKSVDLCIVYETDSIEFVRRYTHILLVTSTYLIPSKGLNIQMSFILVGACALCISSPVKIRKYVQNETTSPR